MKTIVSTPNAPSSLLFSQGVKAGPFLYVSGMTGFSAGSTIQQQTTQALTNCRAIVEAGGGAKDDIVQVTVLLTHPPARAVTKLGVELPNVLVSIMMTAYIEAAGS